MHSKARRTLVGVTAALMIAAPAAQAMPVDSALNGRPAHIAPASTTPYGMEYGDLRAPARHVEPRRHDRAPARSAAGTGVGGFDWTSGGIGVLVAAALALAAWTALGTRRPVGRRATA